MCNVGKLNFLKIFSLIYDLTQQLQLKFAPKSIICFLRQESLRENWVENNTQYFQHVCDNVFSHLSFSFFFFYLVSLMPAEILVNSCTVDIGLYPRTQIAFYIYSMPVFLLFNWFKCKSSDSYLYYQSI